MEKLDLKSLIKQYPGCMESRAKLRSTLTDCYPQPEHKREINLALIVYESGLLTKIREKDSLAPHETAAMCAKIENEYGIPPELSVWAIVAWGEVWGTSVSAAITQAPNPAPVVTEPAPQPAPKPITPVQGSMSEYVIEEREEGWFITKFQGFEQENMTVPNIIDGKPIVGLEGGVFKGCKGIKTMTISEGIRFLREVREGRRFFREVREGNKTARYAYDKTGVFQKCSVEQVQLPNTLEEIGSSCFEDSPLKSIAIPNGVTYIGEYAFMSCELTSVEIPDTVVDIGENAFSSCYQLTSVVLPKHLEKISRNIFWKCRNLSSVVIPEECQVIQSWAFKECEELSNVVIPDGCQVIASEAFIRCRALKEIRIPPSVTSIGSDAFDKYSLETIYCAPGSEAMRYAREEGIKCLPL